MHGIQRERRHSSRHDTGVGVSRVVVRYADGRVMNFVPDARRPPSTRTTSGAEKDPDPRRLHRGVVRHQHQAGLLGRPTSAPGRRHQGRRCSGRSNPP
jgi:hypothetical protein